MSDFIYITLGVVVFMCIGLFLFFQPVLFGKSQSNGNPMMQQNLPNCL